MGQVTGAQGRVIHSWGLCFPELKGEYHEFLCIQARMLGGGKLNLHVPLPVSASFYLHGSFLYYLSTPEILNNINKYGPARVFQIST